MVYDFIEYASNQYFYFFSDISGCTSNSHCPADRPTCEDGKCVNKGR